ncbi:MAG TPA: SLC13 family permease [Blastocatellia bacterium]|jgi:di/tricarboxylate transporter
MQIALVLILLVIAIVLFSLEFIPLDVVALAVLSLLLITGTLGPDDAFAGFGSDTVVMIAGLFVMTEALVRTGIVDTLGRRLQRYGGSNPIRLAIMIMLAVSLLSAFISNTAATAVFVPAVIGLARRARMSASKLLMPLAFASILTSSVTLISTSTNIVISGLMTSRGMAPMGMFELAPVGIPIAIAGLLYMFTLGMKLLPDRAEENIEQDYHLRDYLTELIVLPDSPLAGKSLKESKLGSDMDLTLLAIVREGGRKIVPHAGEVLQPADVLLVRARAEDILRVKDTAGLDIKPDFKLPEVAEGDGALQFVEAMIMPGSHVRGRTLNELRFRERFDLTVLAINRRGHTLHSKLSGIPLRIGDVVLLQGSPEGVRRLIAAGDFAILSDVSGLRQRSPKAKYAVAIFTVAIALGTFKLLPFAAAVVVGTLVMFLTRVITPQEAYDAVEWRILVLIGAMIAFGTAMEKTGAASYLAQTIVSFAGHYGPEVILGAFFLLTVMLTQPMSNQAAALVLLPVAIETATALQLNPRSFAMMIAVAASCSYLTPLEPSCVLVYGPGRYRFMDFFKVGALLTIVIFILAMFLVPMLWPLKG